MSLQVFVLSLLLASAQAQYYWGIPCRSADQCASVMGPTQLYQCHQGYCFCANHTSHGQYELCSNTDMMLSAIRSTGLRRNCTTHDDCEGVNGANCLPKDDKNKSSKICLCRPQDMVESADGQRCLPAVTELGGYCQEKAQCTSRLREGAECFESRCRCQPTHHEARHEGTSKRCVRNLGFGDHCKHEEEGCYQVVAPNADNLLVCTERYGCRCKKYWSYNQMSQLCEFSGASQIIVSLSTMSALVLLIAFF